MEIPRGLFGAEEAARRTLARASQAGARDALCGNVGAIDLAREAGLLPVGGFFTMDGLQAAHAARLLKPKAVIPMHWGTFPVLAKDTSAFASHLASVAPDVRLVSMKPGDSAAF